MSYYDTIDDDVKRAKEILAKGRNTDGRGRPMEDSGGTIYGADIYAAYKLLESFVAHIEATRIFLSGVQQEAEHLRQQILDGQKRAEDAERESDAAGQGWAECIELNKRLQAEVAAADRALSREQERRALGHD